MLPKRYSFACLSMVDVGVTSFVSLFSRSLAFVHMVDVCFPANVVRCGHITCFGQLNVSTDNVFHFWENVRASLRFATFSLFIWHGDWQHSR